MVGNKRLTFKNTTGKVTGPLKSKNSSEDELDLTFLVRLILILSLMIPISWTVYSSVLEVKRNYSSGVEFSNYIKENQLEELSILYAPATADEGSKEEGDFKISSSNLPVVAALLPEADNFYRFYDGKNWVLYSINKYPSNEDRLKNYKEWARMGYPDIVIGDFDYNQIIKKAGLKDSKGDADSEKEPEYACIQVLKGAKVYKYYQEYPTVAAAKKVYIKKELLEKYNLKEIDWTKEK